MGAEARTFKRTMRGEKLKHLAAQFYGDSRMAIYIRAASGLPLRGRKPKVGTEVSIPSAWTYRVRPGDTWSDLGKAYLGRRSRGWLLAVFNRKNPKRLPPTKHLITIPAHVYYRAVKTVKLKAVIKLFYRRARSAERRRLAGLIMQYNSMKADVVESGKRITLPLMKLRVRPEMTPAELPTPDPATERKLGKAVKKIRRLLNNGRFEEAAATAMAHSAAATSGASNGARVHMLLCTALVALGHKKMAIVAAHNALEVNREIKLDPAQVSPKVRAIFRKLGPSCSASGCLRPSRQPSCQAATGADATIGTNAANPPVQPPGQPVGWTPPRIPDSLAARFRATRTIPGGTSPWAASATSARDLP
jgi:hypothetical protein